MNKGLQRMRQLRAVSFSLLPSLLVRPKLNEILSDGANQAADLISDATSIPYLNFTPEPHRTLRVKGIRDSDFSNAQRIMELQLKGTSSSRIKGK
jgi:hypothetical protein